MFKDQIIRLITFDYYIVNKIISEFVKNKKRIKVLDLGCGTGTLAPHFSSKKYIGLDIDENSIKIAKKSHTKYKFMKGDTTKFSLKEKFDLILVVGVIHHLNDLESKKTFSLIKKHLFKNGKALIIEAIPPICKFNIVGDLLRKLDKGAFVRKLDDYQKLAKELTIEKSFKRRGGIVDYGVLYISN